MKRKVLLLCVSILMTNVVNAHRHDSIENRLAKMVDAFAFVESTYNPAAVNGDCVGYLQISPIMVREVNRLLGEERYTLNDRWDKNKSIEMFCIIMRRKNPTLNIRKACITWNGKGTSQEYVRAIQSKMEE